MKISVIIPARNEEENLPICLSSVRLSLDITRVDYEIIVVINRCTDQTEKIARDAKCKIVYSEDKNLSAIRNKGADAATGDILVTIDADSRVSKNMFSSILAKMKSGRYAGGGVMMYPERVSLGIFLTYLALVPIALKNRILCGLFFVSRELFYKIGKFDENLYSAEDIDFACRLRNYAEKNEMKYLMLFRAHIVTSCRKFDHFGDWYFLKNFREMLELLNGRNRDAADKIWYDIDR